MPLPDFIIIGAQKAGTTTLWAQLRLHPDIFMAPHKETNFFLSTNFDLRGVNWYENQFPGARPGQLIGEATPAYTLFPVWGGVPERMRETVPDVKLIYVLRNPIERMRSAWIHARAGGMETRPMPDALTERYLYLSGSSYALQADQYLRCFDADRILYILAEDLFEDSGGVLAKVCAFLGLSPLQPAEPHLQLNASRDKRVLRRRGDLVASILETVKLPKASKRVRTAAKTPGAWRGWSRDLRPAESEISPRLRQRLIWALEPDLRRLAPRLGHAVDPWGLLDTIT